MAMVFAAFIVMFPPRPLLLVPLSIWEPVPIVSEFAVIEIFPASPHCPAHLLLTDNVKMPLGCVTPRAKRGTGRTLPASPDMLIVSALIVTFPPCPLVAVLVLIRAPPVMSSLGVVIVMSPALPRPETLPNELLNMPVT